MTHWGALDADLWDDSDDELLANVDTDLSALEAAVSRDAQLSGGIVPMSALLPSSGAMPLEELKRGYLWVSDMVSQTWCEQQMVYKMAMPTVVDQSPAMSAGSDLHLARELEVQDYVKVSVTSNEDIFAVKVVNLLFAVRHLLEGGATCREVPIFGAPFGQDIFFMGMIDELRSDPDTMELELTELKTRLTRSTPSAAQQKSHHFQTMMYKKLFDDLVLGRTTKEQICGTFKLDLKKHLGPDILKHGLRVDKRLCKNLDEMLNTLLETMQSLTCIRGLMIEYCFQQDGTTIGLERVEYDETWYQTMFDQFAMFWKGRRQPVGVDIEEAWKCQKCDFADVCEWRATKSREYARKKTKS